MEQETDEELIRTANGSKREEKRWNFYERELSEWDHLIAGSIKEEKN